MQKLQNFDFDHMLLVTLYSNLNYFLENFIIDKEITNDCDLHFSVLNIVQDLVYVQAL